MKRMKTLWAEFKTFAFKGNMIDLAVAVVIGAAFSGVINSLVKDIIMPLVSYAVTGVKEAKDAAVNVTDKATQTFSPATQPATKPADTTATPTPATATTNAPAAADQMIASSAGKSKEWKEMVSAFSTALAADRAAADARADIKAAADKKAAAEKDAAEKPVDLSWKVGRLNLGNFLASLLNFVIIAFAVFIIIVKMLGGVMKRAGGTPAPEAPTTKECSECLSIIPIKARRCSNCTSQQPPESVPTT
jgi:large-conductance mechanosensitive channel